MGVTRQTIYNWIDAYTQAFDPLALVDAARSGRPATWTPELKELLGTLLHESPMEWDYQAANWTVPLLGQQLATWDGRWLSEDTIRRRLHELGYVWKRTRYVLPPDPEKEKKRRIRRRLKNLTFRSVTLFEDETDLLLFLPLRAAWSMRGQPAPVHISGANAKRVIFGTINIHTGSRLHLEQKRHRGENFQAFLELVHWHYRGWHVAMVLDEDSSHTAHASTALADWLGIELLWFAQAKSALESDGSSVASWQGEHLCQSTILFD